MRILQGNIHQGDKILFPIYNGVQCCATSVVACGYGMVYSPDLWTAKDIDACIHVGTDLHSKSKPSQETYLYPHEVDERIKLPNGIVLTLIVNREAEFIGPIHETSRFGILTCSNYSFGMILSKNKYWIFDSHAKNERGEPDNKGKAILIKFNTINEIVLYYRTIFNITASYSITVIQFKTCASHSMVHPVNQSKKRKCEVTDFALSQHLANSFNLPAENAPPFEKQSYGLLKSTEHALSQPLGDSLNQPAEITVSSPQGGSTYRPEKNIKQTKRKQACGSLQFDKHVSNQPLGDSMNQPAETVSSPKGGITHRPEKNIKQTKKKQACGSLKFDKHASNQPLGDSMNQPAENVSSPKGGITYRPEKNMKRTKNKQPLGDSSNQPAEKKNKPSSCNKPLLMTNVRMQKQKQKQKLITNITKSHKQTSKNSEIQTTAQLTFKHVQYFNDIREGPTYICSCCGHINFKNYISLLKEYSESSLFKLSNVCIYNSKQNDKYIVCGTCKRYLLSMKVPNNALVNGVAFPELPDVLQGLTQLEERLLAVRQPFMKIVELSKYAGPQYGLQGSCVNVPTELNDTVNVLPRNLSESETIIVKLQRRMEDKIPYIYEVIRPHKVYQAAEYLTKTEVYIKHNITLDPQWLENTNKQCDIINIQNYDDNVSPEIAGEKNYEILLKESDKEINELDETSTLQTSNSKNGKDNILYDILCDSDSDDASSSNESVDSNTHMQEQESMIIPENIPDHLTQNTGIKMAPGEGKVPISFLKDEDVDVLTYPTIYGGKPRQFKYSLKDAEMRKFELKSFDRRAANNIPKLFMTFCKSRLQRLVNRISIALRKKKSKRDCPMFNPDEPSSIAECEKFIDEFMTCKKDDSLGDLINRQYHKHSFTCKRGKQKCRFNYPLVPMRNTKILFPLDDIETNEKKDLQTLFKKIKVDMEKIAKVNEDCSFAVLPDWARNRHLGYFKCHVGG
ncbi:Secretory phospholipase A2 receptor [Frankliniella fusca]|uniref:Secretory phospholipase A2 receptor n=1 Tax=Frankliniella fusca TaxID=407009 RepID=A0AAE1HSD1_9NEOP|nr:Secretory phospholipase A2 receptor [Frankliniella fusca]